MPAKSKAQQQMFGIAHAIQQGKMPASKARGPATDVAKAAKPKDVKDFASTSTKNLPKKVKKEDIQRIREYVTKIVREVLAEGKSDELRISQGQDGDWWVNGPGGYQDGPFKTQGKAWGAMVYYKKRGITSQGVSTNLKEWSVAPPNAGAGQSEWEIWNGGKIRATAPNKEAATKLKNKMKLSEAIEPQRYTMKQDEESGDWHVWDGKTLHKSFDADDRRTASKTLWTLRKNENVNEAYNRGTAVISINGRNGHVRWRTSDGQYDEDLPGKRSKEHVQRRVAQIKKKLWGYTIKINDPDGMLKEAKFEFEWYQQGRWLTKTITGSEHDANVMLDKIRDRVRAAGEATGNVSYTKVG